MLFRKCFLLTALIASATAASYSSAAVITSTSFENETPGDQYVDTGDAAVDHDLVNNASQSPVDSTVVGAGILGFDASYRTSGSNGLTDGDFVGVTGFTGTVGAFTDGAQGYQMSDTDGTMVLDFDPVNISGLGEVMVSFDAFVQATGWESADVIRFFVDVDGTETDLLNTAGSDIDDLGIEGAWAVYGTSFTGSTAALTIELTSNSSNEAIFVDNVVFETVTAIPEPSSLAAMLFIGAVTATRRRRR